MSSAFRKKLSRIISGATFIKVSPASAKNVNLNSQRNIQVFRFTIFTGAFMGINRMYLLSNRKFITICFTVIGIIYILFFILLFTAEPLSQNSFILYHQTLIVEFGVLCVCSNILQKKKLSKMFEYLTLFDDKLQISNEVHVLTSTHIGVYIIVLSLLYYIAEMFIIRTILPEIEVSAFLVNFIIFTHVTEQVFFCTAMKAIFKRLSVLKAHVAKILHKFEKRNEVEDLCENIHLDIEDIHHAYDLLYRCGKNLNSAMNIPMLVMTMASGLSTVVLIKTVIQYLFFFQQGKIIEFSRVALFFITMRCIQYTTYVFTPSLYASFAYKQVTHIRKLLGEALNTNQIGMIERRKLKAFFLLTQVNDFAYTLLGVIRLDMTVPLSYVSICITYLIIAMQFSKFGD